jgi:hypothetical protein
MAATGIAFRETVRAWRAPMWRGPLSLSRDARA